MAYISTHNVTHGRSGTIPPDAMLKADALNGSHAGELAEQSEISLAIVDSRALGRECLARCIAAQQGCGSIRTFGSIEELRRKKASHAFSAILFNIGARKIADPEIAEEMKKLTTEFSELPVLILSDTDELTQILQALEAGARGYIPSSVGIDVCIEAIRLSLVGGIFVPASSVLAVRQLLVSGHSAERPMAGFFTVRQAEVVEALRRGKPNKIIAYELNLRESTVKVHIRNIMKKLKATNRTEVAYRIHDLFPGEFLSQPPRGDNGAARRD